MDEIAVRPVHDHEWRQLRALRLHALQDEATHIAFVDNFDDASSRPDEFWQQRAIRASLEAGADADARQFVAVMGDGTRIGTVTVIVVWPDPDDAER